MSANGSSQISGQNVNDICKLYASYLCARIYHEPEGNSNGGARFKSELDKAKVRWKNLGPPLDDNKASGAVGALYEPVGTKDENVDVCWPMLVFRGTDFDDFRGTGIALSISTDRYDKEAPSTLEHIKNTIINPIGTGVDDFYKNKLQEYKDDTIDPAINDGLSTLDNALNGEDALDPPNVPLETTHEGKSALISVGWIRNHPEIRTAEQARTASGYKTLNLIDQSGKFGIGPLSDIIHVRADLMYKEDDTGDWVTNLLQGTGSHVPGYLLAINYALQCFRINITPRKDKRLYTTGHSLGGGLAGAANMVLNHKYSKNGFTIKGLIFNPAGVHPETLNRYAQGASISDGILEIWAVPGDILTTLAWYPNQIPLFGGVLRLSKYPSGLPKPWGSVVPCVGVSPGPIEGGESWDVPPKNNRLAKLFPLSEQNALWRARATHNFKNTTAISDLMLNAGSINDFAVGLVKHINQNYSKIEKFKKSTLMLYPSPPIGPAEIFDFIQAFGEFKDVLMEEINDVITILNMSAGYHGIDFCIATIEAKLKGIATTVYPPYAKADSTQQQLKEFLEQDNRRISEENEANERAARAFQEQYEGEAAAALRNYNSNGGLSGIRF